jgi:hypothetical protein
MMKYYRTTKLTSRLLFLGSILLLGAALAWQYEYNFAITLGIIVGLGLLIEVIAFYPRQILTTLIIFLQIATLSTLSLLVGSLYEQVGQDGELAILTGEYLSLLSVIIITIAVRLFPSGRNWVNLLISFSLFNLTYVALVGFTANYLVGLSGAFAVAALYIALRTIRWKKTRPVIFKKQSETVKNKTVAFLLNHNYTILPQTLPCLDLLAVSPDGKQIFGVYSLDVYKTFSLDHEGMTIDDKSATPALEQLLLSIKASAKASKTSSASITPVIMLHKTNLASNMLTVKVRTRRNPDRIVGTVQVVNANGFEKLMKLKGSTSKRDARKFSSQLSE